MTKNLTRAFLGFCFLLLSQAESNAQINKLVDYENTNSPAIGTYKGVNFREAGFSGLYPIAGTNGTEFWVCSDRGVNVDCANANLPACRPTYDKMYAFPSYAPKIHRIRVIGNSIQILQTITIKRPNGTVASGIINPTGLGSTATEVASTDTVQDCANFNLKTTPKDTFGIDAEGIILDKDGNFWLCEEGGPTIWKVSPNGVLLTRYTPYANLSGLQSVDVAIDTAFKYRRNNRGFEGIAMAPNGKIYAAIQSPIYYPSSAVAATSRIHRILEIDPATNVTRMLVYINDGTIGASGGNQIRPQDWKIGDMAAINDSTFLVLEAAARGTSDFKRLYMININGATAVNSGLYGGTSTLEALADSTGLAGFGIKAVRKTLEMDLLANAWPAAYDKAEGLAIINDSTIAICNDNDYGQSSSLADGIPVATNLTSHLVTYRLSGADKLANYRRPIAPTLSQGQTGLSSSQTPYLLPAQPGVTLTSIITVGDSTSTGYKMAGIPDGAGAYDNGNGTFTLLVNHELGSTAGGVRAHGAKGAFVSKWVINKSNLSVVSGSDLISKVNLYTPGVGYTLFNPADTTSKKAFGRFCSADLPPINAFYNPVTGLGTQERIFMNGEENGTEGRAFGHIATGVNAGTSYELPGLGKFSWENAVATPASGNLTVVAGTDDATPGQVYMYIGTKTNTGTEVDRAGLTNGKLYGVAVAGLTTEVSGSFPTPNTAFTLVDLGNVKDSTGAALNTRSNSLGVTNFLRPEDGAWDPASPNDFYFVTTNAFTAPSRLWRLRFNDIKNPTTGGTITAVLDGTEGPKMMDNIGFDNFGNLLIQEDVGSNAHIGKIWQYNTALDQLTVIAYHDSTRFIAGAPNFLTIDEEASGIIDVQDILGAGNFLMVDQAHYALPGDLVEGGQILRLFNPKTANAFAGAGPSSTQTPYIVPAAPGVKTTAIITVGDSTSNGYKMVGIPDGAGAYDNGNGTFTLLVNHELGNTVGGIRAHGARGAFVSKWMIDKKSLAVISGADLISKVNLYTPGVGYTLFNPADTTSKKAFGRFCSADLPPINAFYNPVTGLGTQERIFMNGEENGTEGRAFGHIATGVNAGTTYELPGLGKFSWENAVATPASGNLTVVAGTDDATPGQVYIYIGTKTNTGTEVDRAGLTNGKLYGVAVNGLTAESSTSLPFPNTQFFLLDLGNVRDSSGAALNTRSNTLGVTNFLRPEDGAWDPANPNDFYFVTTNAFTAPSRLWRLRFNDIKNPTAGGTINAVLDGTEGPKMMDNIGFDNFGNLLIQEDVGSNAHLGKTWQYNTILDKLTLIASHDSSRFVTGAPNFLTIDEEGSGIIDVQDILGAGNFLMVDQAHYAIAGDLVEGGQILSMFNPTTANAFAGAGPNSSQSPYLLPATAGVDIDAIITVGDSTSTGYKMVGIPDGAGAYDNGNGTFTLLVNHELGSTAGGVRAHGAKGAFVSKWVINKSNLSVVSGSDLISKVNLYTPGIGYTLFNPADTTSKKAFGRFCSADLPPVNAFFNPATGLGTQERIFMNGEEIGAEGRAFGHIATGVNAGTSYELPGLGKFSWENAVATPASGNLTVVAGTDDATPGQVYMYVGTKTNTGTEVDRAGLTNGKLYGVAVAGLTTEVSGSFPTPNTAFTMVDLGNVRDSSGAALNTRSNNLGVTNFLRPEDGAWDPASPNDFYFVTTNAFTAPSRLWRLRFNDIKNPTTGGTITAVLDGTEGPKMMDNIGFDNFGHLLIQEDVGNNIHIGKVWEYTTATDQLRVLAYHDSTRFITGAPNFLTIDEEASGIIDVQDILGAGNFLMVDQAHYTLPGDLVEGGQILKLYSAETANSNPEVSVFGGAVEIPNNDVTPLVSDSTDFGSSVVGTSRTRTYSIRNAGPGSLTLRGISFTGANAADFALNSSLTFPISIPANGTQNIVVRFIALGSGTRSANIQLNTNDFDEGTFTYALRGTVSPADINIQGNGNNVADGDVTPATNDNTDFGTIDLSSNASRAFSIQNIGSDSLRVTGITFTGAQNTEFALTGTNSFPMVIAPGTNRSITVRCTPIAFGLRSATVNIASNDADENPYDFSIQATAITPEINIQGNNTNISNGDNTPSTVDFTNFGSVSKNGSINREFVVQNIGNDTLSITGASFTGTNASEFTLVAAPTFPLAILPNGSASMTVKFTPTSAGVRSGTINIGSNDLDEPAYSFALQGNSLEEEIVVIGDNNDIASGDVTPTVADNTDFGAIEKDAKRTNAFTVRNTGSDSLQVSAINFTGTNASEFTLVNTPTLPWNIAPNASQTISVQFAPLAEGNRTATISIVNSDENEGTFTFSLKGEATRKVGLNNANQLSSFVKLFPNPTSDNTTLTLLLSQQEEVTVNVVDIQGKEAIASVTKSLVAGENNLELPTAGLQNGVYFIHLTSGNKSNTIKLVVMH